MTFQHNATILQQVKREYICLVSGNIKHDKFTVDKEIARDPKDRKKMAVVSGGRRAVTHFEVIERFGVATLVKCTLETGRTHQIRVHMSSLGHPVFCDEVYGGLHTKTEINNASKIKGQCLHARTLGFTHPTSGERLRFESDLPEYFSTLLGKLTLK